MDFNKDFICILMIFDYQLLPDWLKLTYPLYCGFNGKFESLAHPIPATTTLQKKRHKPNKRAEMPGVAPNIHKVAISYKYDFKTYPLTSR